LTVPAIQHEKPGQCLQGNSAHGNNNDELMPN